MPYVTARRASAPHRPSCLRFPPPVVPPLPTAHRVQWSGILNARHLPCPGPTVACSRRRQPLCTNTYSFVWPWRFIMARSAARLRRIVGPLNLSPALFRASQVKMMYNGQK